jgi:hypothetical protein
MTGKGRTAIATSVKMLKLALVNLCRCQSVCLESDCQFRSNIPYDKTVQTLALRGRINVLDPEVADGVAREDCTDDRPARVGGNESDQPVADLAEALLWKDPEVLEQDGQFGAKEGRVIDP